MTELYVDNFFLDSEEIVCANYFGYICNHVVWL